MIYFTSDTHFFYMPGSRKNSFNDYNSMHNCLINNWNEKINKEDDVYIVGDFSNDKGYFKTTELLKSLNGNKYLTLVAPYIHEDTELIYNVASVITMLKKNMLSLSSNTQSTQDFIDAMEKHDYFSFLHLHTQKFINELKNRLNSISLSDNDLLQKQ